MRNPEVVWQPWTGVEENQTPHVTSVFQPARRILDVSSFSSISVHVCITNISADTVLKLVTSADLSFSDLSELATFSGNTASAFDEVVTLYSNPTSGDPLQRYLAWVVDGAGAAGAWNAYFSLTLPADQEGVPVPRYGSTRRPLTLATGTAALQDDWMCLQGPSSTTWQVFQNTSGWIDTEGKQSLYLNVEALELSGNATLSVEQSDDLTPGTNNTTWPSVTALSAAGSADVLLTKDGQGTGATATGILRRYVRWSLSLPNAMAWKACFRVTGTMR